MKEQRLCKIQIMWRTSGFLTFKALFSLVIVLGMTLTFLPIASAASSNNYKLTGNYADDVIAVAVAQEGKQWSDLGSELVAASNGTSYQGQWCGNFVWWCGYKAGLVSAGFYPANDYFATAINPALWIAKSKNGNIYIYDTFYSKFLGRTEEKWKEYADAGYVHSVSKSFVPLKGDIIIYGKPIEGRERIAIQHTGYIRADGKNGNIYTVEGNTSSGVKLRNITADYYEPTYLGYPIGYVRPNYEKHTYDSLGKCTDCGKQFPLNITSLNQTFKISSANNSGTAPAHSTPYAAATVTKRYNVGDTITVKGKAYNAADNLWYQLSDGSWLVSSYLTFVKDNDRLVSNGTYTLIPKCAEFLMLDVKDASTKNQANIQVATGTSNSAQRFEITYLDNGYYEIVAKVSGLALDVSANKSGANVWQWTRNKSDAQLWKIIDAGGGYYYLQSKLNNNYYLTIENAGTKSGTNVQITTKNNSDSQRWKLTTPGTAQANNAVYTLTVKYNANGGAVSSDTYSQTSSGMIQKSGADASWKWAYGEAKEKGLVNASSFGLFRTGYTFLGWSISQDSSTTVFDEKDASVKAETIYPNLKNGNATVVLYAIWKANQVNQTGDYSLICYPNYSGKNYLMGTDFTSSLSEIGWASRDTSVSTISIDSSETYEGYNSVRIVNTSAGSSGKDMEVKTLTQGNQEKNGYVGDNKSMILSFVAKSTKAGTKMYFRWGYEKEYRSVMLGTDWQRYTVRMDKSPDVNHYIHPYVDRASTVWLSEVQLEDGTSATAFSPESEGEALTTKNTYGQNYVLPSAPARSGYSFDGWYTAASGGLKYLSTTPVTKGHRTAYAHWIKDAETYNITYDANGGKDAPARQSITAGQSVTIRGTMPTRSGYTFAGWSSSPNGIAYYQPGDTCSIRGSTTLYAIWNENQVPAQNGVHFGRVTTYFQDQFYDVPANQWYTDNVADAFELGLMKGQSQHMFYPYGDVTIAEAITMASRIHSIFTNGGERFDQSAGNAWYQTYLDYAYSNGIISSALYNSAVTQKANRAQFAEIFANALPDNGLNALNTIADDAVPDVPMSSSFSDSVYKLYRAGVLTGGDVRGTFSPYTFITRAEAAAIVSRMAESDNRVGFTLR